MPTTTRITTTNSNNNHRLNTNIDVTLKTLSFNSETNTKTNKKKSFWSHSSLVNETTTSNLNQSTILLTGKRLLQEKFNEIFVNQSNETKLNHSISTQSFRHCLKNENKKLFKSNTMSLSERRQLQLIANNRKQIKKQSTSSYDKLFAVNTIQKDESYEQYSQIYKEFTDDCLRPFFNQQNEPINKVAALSSIQEVTNELQEPLNTTNKPDRYIYVGVEIEMTRSSTPESSSLSIRSTNSELARLNQIKTSSQTSLEWPNARNSASPTLSFRSNEPKRIVPKPQPRSIYLNYDKHIQKVIIIIWL